jgi:hypothetical protein
MQKRISLKNQIKKQIKSEKEKIRISIALLNGA